jgi:hypothetical protein
MKPVYVAVALERIKEQLWVASFNQSEDQCRHDAEKRFPGLPICVMTLLQSPTAIRETFFQFLASNDIPKTEYGNCMKILAEAILQMFDKPLPEGIMVKLWGVGGHEHKHSNVFFAHSTEFATPAEAAAFKAGLAAAATGQWHDFVAYDTQSDAENKAVEMNGPNYE